MYNQLAEFFGERAALIASSLLFVLFLMLALAIVTLAGFMLDELFTAVGEWRAKRASRRRAGRREGE